MNTVLVLWKTSLMDDGAPIFNRLFASTTNSGRYVKSIESRRVAQAGSLLCRRLTVGFAFTTRSQAFHKATDSLI
jgi:hypothetical protein